MSKPIYTPKQVTQILDAANEWLRKNADYRREVWKPVETALDLLESLKDGKVEIREIESKPIQKVPYISFMSKESAEAWAADKCRSWGWKEAE